jgi:hypothetical protein
MSIREAEKREDYISQRVQDIKKRFAAEHPDLIPYPEQYRVQETEAISQELETIAIRELP